MVPADLYQAMRHVVFVSFFFGGSIPLSVYFWSNHRLNTDVYLVLSNFYGLPPIIYLNSFSLHEFYTLLYFQLFFPSPSGRVSEFIPNWESG